MSDWPLDLLAPSLITITTGSLCSASGQIARGIGSFSSLSAAWNAANQAIFIPFGLELPWTPTVAVWENGATVNGNIDAGIYDMAGTRLISTGSTAQSGVSVIQSVTLTSPPALAPGMYQMAFVSSSITNTFRTGGGAGASATNAMRTVGVRQLTTALPLPSTATPVALTSGVTPWLVFAGVATV